MKLNMADRTAEMIYGTYKNSSYQSRRLGASIIGRECTRSLWYSFRHVQASSFPGRILRLFDTGHSQESRIIKDLKKIMTVYDTEPNSKNQITFSAIDDHFVCKLDGVVQGVPEAPKALHVLEIKTCNDKGFKKPISPEHMAQCQIGMGLSKLDRALYLRLNKNDEQISTTRLHFDKKLFEEILEKAKYIIYSPDPPPPTESFMCKWCDYLNICNGRETVKEKNCRTCLFSSPYKDGKWMCTKAAQMRGLVNDQPYTHYKEDYTEATKTCDYFIMLPSLSGTTEEAEKCLSL